MRKTPTRRKQKGSDPDLTPILSIVTRLHGALSREIHRLPETSNVRASLECIRHDSVEIALQDLERLAIRRDRKAA